jgi:hypothetical protein
MAVRTHFIKYKNNNKVLVFFSKMDTGMMKCYDGNELTERAMTRSDLIKSKTEAFREHLGSDCIIESYNKFIKDMEHLKQLTGNDLNKYDYSITDLCLALYYERNKCYEFEAMDEFETTVHLKCRRGGLMFADPSAQGKMACYDINSSYPSVMCENYYPYTHPEYSIMTDRPEFGYTLGCYHAHIHDIDRRLMTISATDWYTSVDLQRAEELGYKIELIQDGEYNALQYKKHIRGVELFGGYINEIYQYKNTINPLTGQKNPIFKSILNDLHGLLSQRQKKYYTNDNSSEPFETFDPRYCEIYERDDEIVVKTKSPEFKRPHARLLTFITALARTKISKLVEAVGVANVCRIQTDSFLTNVDTIKTDDCIGGLKLEYSGEYSIQHVNKITCMVCGKSAKACNVLGCC